MPKVRNFTVLPALPDSLKNLDIIARNLFWSWNPEFVELFKRIDPTLWNRCGHNPVKMLGSISQHTLDSLAENHGFINELNRAAEKLKSYLASERWFDRKIRSSDGATIAYFSAEFGLHESLPIYSGGLGVLSGDHLKSASDLGIPMVAVGLLYQKGYFRQYLNTDGWQQEVYVENDFYSMPVTLMKNDKGEPVTIKVGFPSRAVTVQIWRIDVGRIQLYMLDTNVPENTPEDRMITANLYGGDLEMRISQEIILGIGGLRALHAIGIYPNICHMNEGHAAFMALERIRIFRETASLSFDEALQATKAGNVFTIHTPVKAGNDEFPPEMIKKYFKDYIPTLGITQEQFMALGRIKANDNEETFKMPVLALQLSSFRNGVSRLHGEVSRKMWSGLWSSIPLSEVPITSITNGIHVQTWLSREISGLYDRYLGPNWIIGEQESNSWDNIENIPDEEFWRAHQRCKEQLVGFARERLKAQVRRRGTYHSELNWAEEVLDPEALTIGFARRFATYKRGNLLMTDPERFVRILTNKDRPIQFIFAGKAHPRDTEGKDIIRSIIHFASKFNIRRRIVFLEDYDMDVARYLVQGVDVWLNNPRPPMEASGTSGMKAALNGVLNLSTYDGWWCEGYHPQVGWVIGSGEQYDDNTYQDTIESQAIYNLLENEIVPLFYTRATDNLPRAWIHRVKKSIQWIAPRFNTHRMLAEYTRRFYSPALEKAEYLTAESMSKAKALAKWQSQISKAWKDFSIKDVLVNVNGYGEGGSLVQVKVGTELHIRALVRLGKISPEDVSVELFHGSIDAWGNIKDGSAVAMRNSETAGEAGEYWFDGDIRCKSSGRQGIAVRILPKNDDLVNPYEPGLILWENN